MEKFEWSKEAEKQWDDRSTSWNSISKEMWESGSRKDIVPFFSEYVSAGSSVCDLGCGDGFGSFKLAEAGYNVAGIDVSEEMIEKAKEINQHNRSQFMKGDISSLPYPDDSFDGVLAINSLEWTEDPLNVLVDSQRIVKPGGFADPLNVLVDSQRIVKPGGFACIGILGPTAAPRVNSYRRLYKEKVICNTMMPWEFEKLAAENNWHKVGEYGVYKRGADQLSKGSLSLELRQSLSFMWVFMLKNGNKDKGDEH